MHRRVLFIIDGAFARHRIFELKPFYFIGPEIRKYCLAHLCPGEELAKILFYDALPFMGKGLHPLTGQTVDFSQHPGVKKNMEFLDSIRTTPQMALRLGRTAWQPGQWRLDPYKLKALLRGEITLAEVTADDIRPDIRQKAVDMRFGLDIATISLKRQAERLVLIANDADFVPVVKLARKEGIVVALDPLKTKVADDLREHVDYVANKLPPLGRLPRHVFVFDDPKEFDPSAVPAEEGPADRASPVPRGFSRSRSLRARARRRRCGR